MDLRRLLARTEVRHEEKFQLKAGPDGYVREPCWFCGAEASFKPREAFRPDAASTGVAFLMIESSGGGESMHGLCHQACAERAKGSLRV